LDETLSPIILSALIYLAASSPTLKADESFTLALVNNANRVNDRVLQMALEAAFATQLSREDIDLLGKLEKSAKAKRAWQFFSALPWSTPASPQSGLFTISGRSTSPMHPTTSLCDVAVLIAKKDEFRAFLAILGEYRADNDLITGKSSYRFDFPGSNGMPLSLTARLIGGMGNERSSLWAHKLDADLHPRVLVSMGIAGGIHDDVRLGDVVVANQVDSYLADAKAVPAASPDEYDFGLAGDPFKTDIYFTNAAQNIEFANATVFRKWQGDCVSVYDQALASNKDLLIDRDLLRLEPRLEEGHIASGPVVGAATAFTAWLKRKRDRSYLALEMESAGAALAVHESASKTRHLVIRGISDFADERKKQLDGIGLGGIRSLAMQNATRLLLALLSNVPMPDPKEARR
jgi:nucleoside phosphorylase